MAAGAIASDADVIKIGGQPAGRRMTVVTLLATGDMCRMLARGSDAIVTRSAVADDLRMVNVHGGHESDSAMAVFADICRLHVNGTLAHRGKPVMTRNTVSDDADMVENSR